eukprot:4831356-Amphidinium_carterae.2
MEALGRTLLLLLDIVDVEPVDNYGEKIREMVEELGNACWFLICQADCRMRSENFERIHRKLEGEYQRVENKGPGGFRSCSSVECGT